LGETFGIVYQAHNALDDAKTCGTITCMAAEKYDKKTLKDLIGAVGVTMEVLG
jgi:DNA polymerase-3 subunit epsilon